MQQILIIGAGKIGSLIAFLLAQSNSYSVHLGDIQVENQNTANIKTIQNLRCVQLDASNAAIISKYVKDNKIEAIISSLPFYCNIPIAKVAAENQIHYFDLTEDVETTKAVTEIASQSKSAFVPQCGLAPGFISIIANHLMIGFPEIETVKMRVGALPANNSNALQYSLTWSTDGLINEYGNPCQAVENGKEVLLQPLEGLEEIVIDGLVYEAFNTSGGIGSLADTYAGRVENISYKTIRYPNHCEKIKFLMNDLKLNEDRKTLKVILENAIPKTFQDVVLVYVSVTGKKQNQFLEESYVKKFYPKTIDNMLWSAIQLTTACGICSALDLVMQHPEQYHGLIRQEQFSFAAFIKNRFGEYYAA